MNIVKHITPFLVSLALGVTSIYATQSVAADNGPGAASGPHAPLATDGTPSSFSWTGLNAFNNEGAFTFSGPGTLEVTDCFIDGDAFEVFNNGASIGTTMGGTDNTTNVGTASGCFASPALSKGSFVLPAGSHSITIRTTQVCSVCTSGGGYLRFTAGAAGPTSIPVAPLWALGLLSGLIVLVGMKKLRKT